MEYKLKHVSSTRKEILLALEKKLIEELVLKKVVKLRNNINMPGFRKGRIPVHIIKKKYENSIKREIISELLDENIKKIILKEKIKPVNTPSIKDISLKNDSEYKLKIQFDSFPVVEIKKIIF